MQRVIKLIKANEDKFSEYAKYYIPLIGKARRNLVKHPDISIETCKALLEGISKTVLIHTKPEWDRPRIEKMPFAKLVTHAMQDLRDNDDVVEDEFKSHVVSFSQSLGTLRNHRSDISHGRGAPKAMESGRRFALLSFQTTEAIALYMFEAYFDLRAAALVVPIAPIPNRRYPVEFLISNMKRIKISMTNSIANIRSMEKFSTAMHSTNFIMRTM